MQNVPATRMSLLSLKGQVQVATRGHKLLKDKQDGLMQEFLQIIHKAKTLRKEVEAAIGRAMEYFLLAQAVTPKAVLAQIFAHPTQTLSLEVKTKNVMSVKLPIFSLKKEGNPLSFSTTQNTAALDVAIKALSEAFELLLKLAEIEKSAEALSVEIEKTRRRVNALEHRLIPDLKSSLKFIKMKLAENERAAIIQVMTIKNMIEASEEAKA